MPLKDYLGVHFLNPFALLFLPATQITVEVARRSTVGTPWYCAPEIINGDEYSYASVSILLC